MYRVFDTEISYTLPDGSVHTGTELVSSGSYPQLSISGSVVDIVGGVLFAVNNAANLSEQYGIDSVDANDIVTKVNTIRFNQNKQLSNKALSQDVVTRAAQFAALTFTDEQAIEVVDLYPEYELNHEYKQNDRFRYGTALYKVNQAHTSQEQWVPGTEGTESLYTNLMLNDAGRQIWKQPTGAHDAYNTGDVVEYKGTLYKSLIDGNVWAPDAYPQGWQEYVEG